MKCKECANCILERNGDEEVGFGERVYTNVEEYEICRLSYDKKFKLEGETDCKKFKERKI